MEIVKSALDGYFEVRIEISDTLTVNKVISADELKKLLNDAGAHLSTKFVPIEG